MVLSKRRKMTLSFSTQTSREGKWDSLNSSKGRYVEKQVSLKALLTLLILLFGKVNTKGVFGLFLLLLFYNDNSVTLLAL